jgi:hypothetical protein
MSTEQTINPLTTHRRPLPPNAQANITIPEEIKEISDFYGSFEFAGADAITGFKRDEFSPSSPVYYWKSEYAKIGVVRNTSFDVNGYPYSACKFVTPINGDAPYWKYTHIASSWIDAIKATERTAQLRRYICKSDVTAETFSEWKNRCEKENPFKIASNNNPLPGE